MQVVEQDTFGPKLCNDASNTPYINFIVIPCPQDNLWRPVAPRLHVGAKIIMYEARITEVYNFYFNWRVWFNEDVLWLEVWMDDIERMDSSKCCQNLTGHYLDGWNREEWLIFAICVIEIVLKQVCLYPEMLLVIGNWLEIEEVVGIWVKISLDESKQLDLVHGLVKEILIICYDFEASQLLCGW